jgi:ribonuclease P protein component
VKKRARLLRPGDFQRVLARPPLFRGTTIVAFASVDVRRDEGRPGVRVGVAAARRISGAVARNRAKRRVREAVRVSWPAGLGGREMGTPYDVVVIARPAALTAPLELITAEVRRAWERLES